MSLATQRSEASDCGLRFVTSDYFAALLDVERSAAVRAGCRRRKVERAYGSLHELAWFLGRQIPLLKLAVHGGETNEGLGYVPCVIWYKTPDAIESKEYRDDVCELWNGYLSGFLEDSLWRVQRVVHWLRRNEPVYLNRSRVFPSYAEMLLAVVIESLPHPSVLAKCVEEKAIVEKLKEVEDEGLPSVRWVMNGAELEQWDHSFDAIRSGIAAATRNVASCRLLFKEWVKPHFFDDLVSEEVDNDDDGSVEKAAAGNGTKSIWLTKALLMKKEDPNLSDRQIANEVGINPSTLGRCEVWQQSKALFENDRSHYMHTDGNQGIKDRRRRTKTLQQHS